MLIHAGENTISGSQCLKSILSFFTLASGTPMLGPLSPGRIVYAQFIYLSIYPPIASKGKQGRNGHIKKR